MRLRNPSEMQNLELVLDTETYPNYFLVSFKEVNSDRILYMEITEWSNTFDPYLLSYILHSNKTIGFNSIKYDLPMLWLAYKCPSLEKLQAFSNELIYSEKKLGELKAEFDFNTYELPSHIDLIEVCPLKGSLKTYGARLHAKHLADLPYEPNTRLTTDQIETVKNYNFNDLDLTELIYKNLSEQLSLRETLSKEYGINLMSKSDAQIAEAVIGSELKRITGHYPKRPVVSEGTIYKYRVPDFVKFQTPFLNRILDTVKEAEYKIENGSPVVPETIKELKIKIGSSIYRMGNGGLHSSEKNEAHITDEVIKYGDFDINSYYPMIILNDNLYPKHLGQHFLTVYKTIVESRLAAKKAKQHIIADSKKLTINGAFGKLGSQYSILYSPDLLIQVTVTGQLVLLMLIEIMELNGISVISANTDGIITKYNNQDRNLLEQIIKYFEQSTNFTTEETQYKAVYSRDINAYVAHKYDNTTKAKNAYFDPWSGGAKTAIFRFHKNPQTTICIEAAIAYIVGKQDISKTIRDCTDITKFISARKVDGGAVWKDEYLGKVIRWYYALGQFEDIFYKGSGNKVPDSYGAKPLMTLPDELPSDINFAFYERKAIDILEELNIFKRKSKAVSFFE